MSAAYYAVNGTHGNLSSDARDLIFASMPWATIPD
jgi:hypothetical protein